ncbi:MAG: hypothetical protein L6V93_11210 [Clostridiales bacterium]|nr:MAG: hypothetical protein L6V93_11210 [Clostridiales bacterium]
MDGTWDGSNYYGGMDEGLVDISPLFGKLRRGAQKEAIDAAKAKNHLGRKQNLCRRTLRQQRQYGLQRGRGYLGR